MKGNINMNKFEKIDKLVENEKGIVKTAQIVEAGITKPTFYKYAIKQYVRRKDKNLRTLMQYAKEFHVEKILRQYLEVLL